MKDLDTIVEVFFNPLRENKILAPKEIAVMFSNIEQISQINQVFLKSLEQRREETPVMTEVGDLISKAVRTSSFFLGVDNNNNNAITLSPDS